MPRSRVFPNGWLWCAICLLPAAVSLGYQAAGPRPRVPRPRDTAPALAFDQYLVNLGNVQPAAEHRAFFAFTNRGTHPVRVKSLRPSCGCLDPKLSEAVYAPGERGVFSLSILATREKPGPKEYYCKVVYEDPEPREAIVTLKVVLPPLKLIVRPQAMIFSQPGDTPITRPIELIRPGTDRLTILDVSSSSPLIGASLGDSHIDPRTGVLIPTVLVTVGSVPPGRHHAWIIIHTNDGDYPEVRVPIRLDGPAAGRTTGRDADTRRQ